MRIFGIQKRRICQSPHPSLHLPQFTPPPPIQAYEEKKPVIGVTVLKRAEDWPEGGVIIEERWEQNEGNFDEEYCRKGTKNGGNKIRKFVGGGEPKINSVG